MGLRIGGGVGPFRASIGTSGFGVGVGPVSVGTGRRHRSSSNEVSLLGVFVLIALVCSAIYWMAVYWFITVPALALLTWVIVVLVRRSRRRRVVEQAEEAARLQQEARKAKAEARKALKQLKADLGDDYDDFMRAAHHVAVTGRAGRDRLRHALGISTARAAALLLLLEEAQFISPPRGSHRDVLLTPDMAEFFALKPAT